MFGKVMSISDDLMWRYYELLTDKTSDEIASMKSGDENPRNLKVASREIDHRGFSFAASGRESGGGIQSPVREEGSAG